MEYLKEYEKWLTGDQFDEETKAELESIKDDNEEIEDRFYQSLEFGTAGLRGKIGAGTNRMNQYTVGLAAQGLADTISRHGEEAKKRGVAIAYDVRHFSPEFAQLSAEIFAGNGIKVYLFDDIRPTPVLSYTIRELGTISGVMVTASHNPRDYNGYKVYWEEGSQILDDVAEEVLNNIEKITDYNQIKKLSLEEGKSQGLIEIIGSEIDEKYLKEVLNMAIRDDIDKEIKIVYSPLNGTGNKLVQEVLKRRGFKNIYIVKEQEEADPDFTTVGYPNPEDPKAFAYSEKLGKEKDAELLIATDPDADRTALEVRNKDGEYVFLTGNEIGALLVEYILSQRKAMGTLPDNAVIVKSLVTGDLSTRIAEKYGAEMIETLTGFKNLYGKANEYDISGEKTLIFGYEESIGYNYGTFVRDKDAVNSAMMIAEMAAYYKTQGKSLLDVLEDLYQEFGYYNASLVSVVYEGLAGQQKIGRIMEDFRVDAIKTIGDISLVKTIDYQDDDTGLPKSNVLKYYYDDGSWFALRPSGTEPKIKLYIYSVGKTLEDSEKKLEEIESVAKEKMNAVE